MDPFENNVRKKPRLNQTKDQEMRTEGEPSSSPRIIDGTPFIGQLLQASNLFLLLDKESAFSLLLTSKQLFTATASAVEEHVTFHFRNPDPDNPLQLYSPKKLKIHIFEWKHLLRIKSKLGKLRELSFYDNFNNPVIISLYKYLPAENITSITFGKSFNHQLGPLFFKYYPQLRHLTFGHDFKMEVDNLLPPSLTHLKLDYYFDSTVNKLPKKLTHLTLGHSFNHLVDHLPQTLTHLTLGHTFNRQINHLPKSLKHLVLGHYYNQGVPSLPNGLEYIKFGYNYNHPVNQLPTGLKRISFGEIFNMPLNTNLPPNITHLSFGFSFSHPLDAFANSKLKYLTIRKGYMHSFKLLPPDVVIRFTHGYRIGDDDGWE